MVKVLFICTGNICRSPTAEGLMRHHVAEAGLAGQIDVDSAGTHGFHGGDPPDPRSIATALKHHIDIRDLRARHVEAGDFPKFDLIVVMEKRHLQLLRKLCPPGLEDRIALLMSFAPGHRMLEVPDPYYDDEGFDVVFSMIEEGVLGLLDHIRRTYPFDPPRQ